MFREHDDMRELEYQQKLQQRKEQDDRDFDANHFKLEGPAVVLVPAGFTAIVYLRRKDT